MVTVYYDKNANKVPIKSWAIPTKDKAFEHAQNVSRLPFTYKHVALMPKAMVSP